MNLDNKRVLVIGGGNPLLYNSKYFYVIGDHATSNYGRDKTWNLISFWKNLQNILTLKKFDAIIFDSGSESWLPMNSDVFNKIINLIIPLLDDNGIILATGLFKNNNMHNEYHRIHTALYLTGELNIVGYFVIFNKGGEQFVYNIFSKALNIESTIITDMTNIYITPIELRNKINYYVSKTDHTKTYYYKKENCVEEETQTEFIKKRVLKINNKNK